MINRFLSWPIRTHMVILLALVALPSMALIVRSGLDERDGAISEAKKDCLGVVHAIAAEQQAIAAGVEQLAATIAVLPEVQSHNSKATSAFLTDLVKRNPHYANIVIGDRSGLMWASAVPFKGLLTMADRRYYQDAIVTGAFSSGEYGVGKVAKKPMMSFGYPITNASHELIGVIGIALDLDYAQQIFGKIDLPVGASFSLVDHQGIILIRNLKDAISEKLVGRHDIREDNFTKAKEGPEEGTFEVTGNDDKPRLVAYRRIRLPHEPGPYLYVRSSVPLASATSRANAAMLRNLSAFAALLLIGLFLAWFVGRRVIVNPILILRKASEELGTGTHTVNVSDVVKGGELGDLARAFDGMAEALAHREADLRQSEERFTTTLASIGDAVIATDVEGGITFMNAVAEDLTGWTLAEATGRPVTEVFNIINEHTRREVESPVAKVLREGTIVGLANHTILVKKDGAEIPIDDSGAPIRDRDGKTMGVVLVFRDITHRKSDEARARHLASFPELNPSPVLEVGLSGEITFCNPASETILEDLGVDKGECGSFLPADIDAILEEWDKKTESILEREVLIKDRVFAETITLIPRFKAARIYARDVTERKRTEADLLRAGEAWERTFASVPDMIAILDNHHRVRQVNEAMARRLGVKGEEVVGKKCYEVVHGLSEPPDFCPHSRTVRDGRQHIEELSDDRLGGDFEVTTTPLHDGQGQLIGSVHVVHDITENKRAERTLQVALQRFYAILSSIYSALLLVTDESRVEFANQAFCDYFELNDSPVDLVGLNSHEIFTKIYGAYLHPDEATARIKEIVDRGEPVKGEQVPMASGRELLRDFIPMHIDGTSYGRLWHHIDITDRKRAEEVIQKAYTELELRVQERTAELNRGL